MKYVHELGYFGNIWVRSNILKKAGDATEGHYHVFDHVSLLIQGKVRVETVGSDHYNEFEAPTFIVIDKDVRHRFIALTDECIWYCVFAVRNLKGEIANEEELEELKNIYGPMHSPFTYTKPSFTKILSASMAMSSSPTSDRTNEDAAIEQSEVSIAYNEDSETLENNTVKK